MEIGRTAGTWVDSAAGGVVKAERAAGAGAFGLVTALSILANANPYRGTKVKSIDVFYKVATAALTGFATVEVGKMALPVSGAVTGAVVGVTLDSGHDTSAKRAAVGDHVMTVTINAPEWTHETDGLYLSLGMDPAATSVVTVFGVRVNYDLRL
jgi:hypothetical protein